MTRTTHTNVYNDNYTTTGKDQRPVRPLPPTAARRLCLPPHPRSSTCYLVHVVVLSAAQFTHHCPVVSVVCAWNGALTQTTMRLAGHTAVLGAGGSLIIGQLGVRSAGGRL